MGDGELVAARRIEPPLEDVAIDDDRAGHLALLAPVDLGADVDDERAGGHLGGEVGGLDAIEAVSGGGEQCVDAGGGHGAMFAPAGCRAWDHDAASRSVDCSCTASTRTS